MSITVDLGGIGTNNRLIAETIKRRKVAKTTNLIISPEVIKRSVSRMTANGAVLGVLAVQSNDVRDEKQSHRCSLVNLEK